jgi:tetratricopeptide (TPR) repeat protein
MARSGRRQAAAAPGIAAVAVLCSLLTLAAFGASIDAPFVSDDKNAIVANERVTGPWDPQEIFTTFSWWSAARADAPGYRPLTTWTFAVNQQLWGLAPQSFHALNFGLHALVCVLLYLVATELGCAAAPAATAAAAFALLPIHTEAVVWVVGRAELLAAAGYLAALTALLRWRRTGVPLWLAAAAIAFLTGVLGKETTATLLAAPLLSAWLLVEGPTSRLLRRRDLLSLAALAACLLVYGIWRWQIAPDVHRSGIDALDNPLGSLDLLPRTLGALSVLGRYIGLLVWPWPSSVDYSYNALGIARGFQGDAWTIAGIATIVAVGAACRYLPQRNPAALFALLLASASYSLVSNLILPIGTIMGERLAYLPTAGLGLALACALPPAAKLTRPPVAASMLAVAALWLIAARDHADVWQSPIDLFENAVSAYPDSARAHMELATEYGYARRTEDALAQYREALRILPTYPAAAYNMGNMLAHAGRYEEAVAAFEQALSQDTDFLQAWHNLYLTHQMRGRPDEGLRTLERAVQALPDNPRMALLHAEALLGVGRWQQAAEEFSRTVALGVPLANVGFARGLALERGGGGCAAAVDDYVAAAEAGEGGAPARNAALRCLHQLGRDQQATRLSGQP